MILEWLQTVDPRLGLAVCLAVAFLCLTLFFHILRTPWHLRCKGDRSERKHVARLNGRLAAMQPRDLTR